MNLTRLKKMVPNWIFLGGGLQPLDFDTRSRFYSLKMQLESTGCFKKCIVFFKISYQKRIWLSNITDGQLNQAEHSCQTPGLDLGIRVNFVLPLSQEEQQQQKEHNTHPYKTFERVLDLVEGDGRQPLMETTLDGR